MNTIDRIKVGDIWEMELKTGSKERIRVKITEIDDNIIQFRSLVTGESYICTNTEDEIAKFSTINELEGGAGGAVETKASIINPSYHRRGHSQRYRRMMQHKKLQRRLRMENLDR